MDKFRSLPIEPTPPSAPIIHNPDPRGPLVAQALDLLAATDYVTVKAAERALTLSAAWVDWREELRRAVRGERSDIPPEPERYAAAVAAASSPPAPQSEPRSGFVLQTRVAELSILVDQIAQDKIAERYPAGRIAQLDALMLDVGRKTADGEMLTEAELAAERDWNAYSAFREAVMDHAQGLKSALMVSTSDQLEDIAAGLHEGWPDGSAD